MTLAIGMRLGPYEILAPLGVGGMGEVYRARDTKLGREVALKVLPESLSRDLERLARFEREAHLLASLNHPNIAHLHGFEDSTGVPALVMELVEGPTLAERIGHGPMPIDEALPIARQIADALEAAHEQGIIHRDLKPANIKVRADGTVKVLDFGLAKAFDPSTPSGAVATMSPTLSIHATQAGFILGTAAYMAPEQARGKPIDKRADIWAFGCVLYEMFTGRRAFEGDDISVTLAAVLKTDPDWSALPSAAPPALRRLLSRCLHKDPRDRLRDIGDARLEIEAALTPQPADERPPKRRQDYVIAGLLVTGLGLGTLAAAIMRSPTVSRGPALPIHLSLTLQSGEVLADGPSVAISHSGRRIAYVAFRDGIRKLFVRDLADVDSRLLPETNQAEAPFFSPDDESIGFFANGKLKRVGVAGGTPVTLCDAPYERGGSWGASDLIVFAPTTQSPLLQVSANGGAPTRLTTLDAASGESGHRWPVLLPNNRAVVFTAGPPMTLTNFNEGRIVVQSLQTGARHVLAHGTYPRYLSTGHLAYVDNDVVLVQRFDVKQLSVTGPSLSILDRVASGGAGQMPFDISATGTVVYAPGSAETPQPMFVVDVEGTSSPLPFAAGQFREPVISPDGRQLAVSVAAGGDTDVWVYELASGARNRLTAGGVNGVLAWTRDGRVVYAGVRGGERGLYWRRSDTSTAEQQLASMASLPIHHASFSADNRVLFFDVVRERTGSDILTLQLPDSTQPVPWLATPFWEADPQVSPDDRWVAYVSNQSDRLEVYVRSRAGDEIVKQASLAGGYAPRWAHSSRELFFLDLQTDTLMAVSVPTDPKLGIGRPRRVIAQSSGGESVAIGEYDVMADDRHFIVVKQVATGPTRAIDVIINWFEELKARVPTR